jgi:ribonuclease HIII
MELPERVLQHTTTKISRRCVWPLKKGGTMEVDYLAKQLLDSSALIPLRKYIKPSGNNFNMINSRS